MYERFTDRARKVIALANQEAQRFNHEYIGTEHILLGLIKEGSGVGANVLKHFGIDFRTARLEVEKLIKAGPEMVTMGKLPQTPRAKKVHEYAVEEARNLNHNYVGTEHILLGLLREHDGTAAQVLMNSGLTLETVREEVLRLLGNEPREEVEVPVGIIRFNVTGSLIVGYPITSPMGKLLTELMEKKDNAIKMADYETAAMYRDQIEEIQRLIRNQKENKNERNDH
jgi:ATP-dependent Clp protease ATP-binding subunit ClpA